MCLVRCVTMCRVGQEGPSTSLEISPFDRSGRPLRLLLRSRLQAGNLLRRELTSRESCAKLPESPRGRSSIAMLPSSTSTSCLHLLLSLACALLSFIVDLCSNHPHFI